MDKPKLLVLDDYEGELAAAYGGTSMKHTLDTFLVWICSYLVKRDNNYAFIGRIVCEAVSAFIFEVQKVIKLEYPGHEVSTAIFRIRR